MISRFQTIAKALVLDHKKLAADNKAVLVHKTWTPHNVKSIYLTSDKCAIRYYKRYNNKDTESISLAGCSSSDEDKKLFDMLYSSSALGGISANIKNIREFVVFYDSKKENRIELANSLGLEGLEKHKSLFVHLSVIFVDINILPVDSYFKLLDAERERLYNEFSARYAKKDRLDLAYSNSESLFWSTNPPTVNDTTYSFEIHNEGTKIKNTYSDLYLLQQIKARDKSQAQGWECVLYANNQTHEYFNIGDYPADEELRKFISDNYWKPLAAQAILRKLFPKIDLTDEVKDWTDVLTSITSMKGSAKTYFSCRTWLSMLLNVDLKKTLISVCKERSGTLSSSLLDSLPVPDDCKEFFKIMSKDAVSGISPQAYENYCKFCSLVFAYYAFAIFLLFPYKNIAGEIDSNYIAERKQSFKIFPLPVRTNITRPELATVVARMNGTRITPTLKSTIEEIYAQGVFEYTQDKNSALTCAKSIIVYKGGN